MSFSPGCSISTALLIVALGMCNACAADSQKPVYVPQPRPANKDNDPDYRTPAELGRRAV